MLGNKIDLDISKFSIVLNADKWNEVNTFVDIMYKKSWEGGENSTSIFSCLHYDTGHCNEVADIILL